MPNESPPKQVRPDPGALSRRTDAGPAGIGKIECRRWDKPREVRDSKRRSRNVARSSSKVARAISHRPGVTRHGGSDRRRRCRDYRAACRNRSGSTAPCQAVRSKRTHESVETAETAGGSQHWRGSAPCTFLEKRKEPKPARCKAMFAELSNYLDEQLDDSMCEELERHLDGCGPCKVFMASLEATIDQCRKSPAATPSGKSAVRLRKTLMKNYARAVATVRP